MPERTTRDFGGKAHCFNTGYARIAHLPHQVIASLDADITFERDYFEFLLDKLANDPSLGIVGTPFSETAGCTIIGLAVPIMFQALARCFDVNVLNRSKATFRREVAESMLSPCLRRGFEVGIRAPLLRK